MSTLLQPGDRCAGHEILRHLATGGTAEVYLARLPTGELRAFKIMKAPGAAKRQARFAQEGEALAMIVHPSVLRVYDADAYGEQVWLSLEMFEGETLAQKFRAGRMPLDDLLHVIQQVCDGLAEAHRVGIVHRDLTPDNILVGPGGTVKVFDFGIAKLVEFGVETTSEQQIGTARYMAPERARDDSASPRMDVYSLGLVLYEGVGGEEAMGPEPRNMMGIVRWHIWGQPRPLRELAPGVSSELAALVHQMLAKDPADRPGSMLEVQARLREERTRLRAPQLRAARNAAPVDRLPAFAPTVPMTAMPDLTAGPAELRSTDVPVESAARQSRVAPRRVPAAAIGAGLVVLAAAASWMFLGRAPGSASQAAGAPRPAAPAPAPAPSAAPSASASASASGAPARPRPPARPTPGKPPIAAPPAKH
jgi:serine/threonine protein kinase